MKALIHDWMTRQAEKRPDATALVFQNERWTYGQLESASNRLARLLIDAGCRKGDRVCFLIPKSPDAIIAMLGILKAHAIYVPVDTASPAARIARVLESCDNRWVLAAGSVSKRLDELLIDSRWHERLSIGWVGTEDAVGERFAPEFTHADLLRHSAEPMDSQCDSSDPAHILFTSGSTGIPKGVVITHANVISFVNWAVGYFGLCSADRMSGHPPLHFDLSTFDIYGAFAVGAELHLIPAELSLLPQKLADFIRRAELTLWFSVPSALTYLAKFDVVRPNDFPALRRLLWCGEVFPTPSLIYWMRRLPHVAFTNLYGPTEATIASSYYTVPSCPQDESAAIPIGIACDGEGLLVLDDRLQPVPTGETGHSYIRGAGLSPGYWRDPAKTAELFLEYLGEGGVDDRIYKTGDLARIGDDGLVYFLGREDSQIKSRGYRIELGEIEAALNATGLVKECAVVAVATDGFEGTTICCAYVGDNGADTQPVFLRTRLTETLPNYMIPAEWRAFEFLPKNANGKIDRRALVRISHQLPASLPQLPGFTLPASRATNTSSFHRAT